MIQENQAVNWVVAISLVLIGLFVIVSLALVRNQAADTTVEVQNAAPTVTAVKACKDTGGGTTDACVDISQIDTAINANQLYDIYATVTDTNGTADIDINTVKATMFRTAIGFAACDTVGELDGNQCVPQVTCAQDSVIDPTNIRVKCTGAAIKYWADPTTPTADDFAGDNWTIRVDATDVGALSGNGSMTKELAELAAAGFPGTINYGSGGGARTLGFASGTGDNFDMLAANLGNVDVDLQIKADAASMTCAGGGTIPVGNQKWKPAHDGPTADVAFGSMTKTLTTNFQDMDLTDVNGNTAIQRRNSESAAPGGAASFGITVPAGGVKGSCSVNISVQGVKQSIAGTGGPI